MLLSLPPELVNEIIYSATDNPAEKVASNLRLTNRLLSILARPFLYRRFSFSTTKRVQEFLGLLHNNPSFVPAVKSILLVPIEHGNIHRRYTRAERDQDLEIFSLHTQALNYTPNTMPTEQMIDKLCIPHLLHTLPKLRSLVLRHESYWSPWIKQILTNWHVPTALEK